jgi:hypothetical protein
MDVTGEPGTDPLMTTRQSLLSRLRDWQDQEGWRESFETYGRLIYNVARKAGLAVVVGSPIDGSPGLRRRRWRDGMP